MMMMKMMMILTLSMCWDVPALWITQCAYCAGFGASKSIFVSFLIEEGVKKTLIESIYGVLVGMVPSS